MNNIGSLLQTVERATGEQRAAIESLVTSASAVLDQVGRQFAETVGAQAHRSEDVAAQVSGSAIELAALGEAFGHGVQLFAATNDKLIDSLQRIETAVGQSMQRSDEQLAYYVAQAREVIDLSISSQQGIVEDLRRLRSDRKSAAESAA
jgi:ABC-type transporter Mla subunit MlaD